jgi:zinc D-Ala-D-Ala carboxypeptidase
MKGFITHHWIAIVIVITAILGAAVFTTMYSNAKTAEMAATTSRSEALSKETATLLKKIEVRKAAEAAALKLKQDAEAKATAQLVITTNESKASTINSASCNTSTTRNNPAAIDVVVNKKHCIQPLTYVPGDLVSSRGATLSANAITSFNALMASADAANEPLSITSSYRSYSNQVSTYNYWVGVSGAAGADTYSARPGYSEHQTGLAFDVADAAGAYPLDSFKKTSQYQWLLANAADYGFIQRYYAGYTSITGYTAEEWHYRYVGVAVAKDMTSKGIKTLEQYYNVSGGDYF